MKTIELEEMPGSYEHWNWGDIHIGSKACLKNKITKFITTALTKKNVFISLGGDQLEAIAVDDKRFSLDCHSDSETRVQAQRDYIIEKFTPVADRVMWILDGNHERKFKNVWNINEDIAKALAGERYGKGGCVYAGGVMLKALFPGYRMLDWHGAGSISSRAGDAQQRKTNDAINLKRKLRLLPGQDCDIVSCHHHHKLIVQPPVIGHAMITDPKTHRLQSIYTKPERLYIDKAKDIYRINEDDTWYVGCGSATTTYAPDFSTYGEEKGYEPTELGFVKITVKNDKLIGAESVVL